MLVNDHAMDPRQAAQYSPLTLAYLGDCVFELLVREKLVLRGNEPNGRLHFEAMQYVCAKGQCAFFEKIQSYLTEEEQAVFRRGRNSNAVAGKNQDPAEYKKATGVETLFGYLYLSGQTRRLEELFELLHIE